VVVGENGTGKSHLLKLAYSLLAVSGEAGKTGVSSSKTTLQTEIAGKLVRVFRPDALGRLVRRRQGREKCEVGAEFADNRFDIAFSFSSQSKTEVVIEQPPRETLAKMPVFLPTRELLTLYPNFLSVYDNYYLEFEETYRDTCSLLGALAIKGPRESRVRAVLGRSNRPWAARVVLTRTVILPCHDGQGNHGNASCRRGVAETRHAQPAGGHGLTARFRLPVLG